MENLQKMITMLLKDVSPRRVIENNIVYNYFTKEEFIRLAHLNNLGLIEPSVRHG